jgi:hypothetical protein
VLTYSAIIPDLTSGIIATYSIVPDMFPWYRVPGDVVAATLLRLKVLQTSGGNYSDPAVFFAAVRNNGWGHGSQSDYVRLMRQRIRHFLN